jgi:hypothetical protein
MAVILFSPLQQLTKRLSFVVLGVLMLFMLSEVSKRHWRLKPTKEAQFFSVAHTDLRTASTMAIAAVVATRMAKKSAHSSSYSQSDTCNR